MVKGLFELEQPDPKARAKIAVKKTTELYLIWSIGQYPPRDSSSDAAI
jgi:hypothetical protein